MPWVNTDRFFGERRSVLLLSQRDHFFYSKLLELIGPDSPQGAERLSRLVENAIVRLRPELEGCIVYAIHFDVASMRWEFGVMHNSFPLVDYGCETKREPLIKQEEAACAS